MYQILLDKKIMHDARLENYVVLNPKCKLKVNTVDSASFDVTTNHPLYNEMKKLKSIVEILQDEKVIFRGRITNDKKNFYNTKEIDIEGVLGFFNDSLVRPFKFPEDFDTSNSSNVVEFFLNWLIENHNSQVQPFQQFKLGKVTVVDPNNYITRASTDYKNTWTILKEKLFNSTLGGYLCIRYENDGNYIDYLKEFELTNTQNLEVGKNILDLTEENDATSTYTAIMPFGAKYKDSNDNEVRLTIKKITDGAINEDLIKKDDTIFSINGVEKYGWIYAPVEESTWDDVTEVSNLITKSVSYLQGDAIKLSNTIEVKAVDLNFTDDEIESLRVNRNTIVTSFIHEIEATYPLESLEIDLNNPQNTKIVLGETKRTLIERTGNVNGKIEDLDKSVVDVSKNVKNQGTTIKTIEKSMESYVINEEYEKNIKEIKEQLKKITDSLILTSDTVEIPKNKDFYIKEKKISFDLVYPIGSIYMAAKEVDPTKLFGGMWEKIEEKSISNENDESSDLYIVWIRIE